VSDRATLKERARKVIGRFSSGRKDISSHHDRYLASSASH
jgi:hypothetical protein